MTTLTLDRLVPAAASVATGDGGFRWPSRIRVAISGRREIGLVEELLRPTVGGEFQAALGPEADIQIDIDPTSSMPPEGYRLVVAPHRVTLGCRDASGMVYGLHTLRQISEATGEGAPWTPGCVIDDAPRHAWRGLLLDVGRWYRTPASIRRIIDLASQHKFNVLHLHLTEDQGWRFEVKRYPRLTEVGAWRSESRVGHWRDGPLDGTPHGGYYTQAELRQLVSYASDRAITIVPEIDLPGHSQAAIAAYPELGNHPEQRLEVATGWGVIEHVLNVEESTVDFMKHVLDELMDVFPSQYIHLGGDECPRTEWRESTRAAHLARERGLTSVDQLEAWFVRNIADHITTAGRTPIGWDEILDDDLPGSTTAVMAWRGIEAGARAVSAGRDVVLAPNTVAYFDQYESAEDQAFRIAADGVITLSDVIGYRPLSDDPSGGRVLGIECALWGEHLPDDVAVDYAMFPRAAAFADIAWGQRREQSGDGYMAVLRAHEEQLLPLGLPRKLTAPPPMLQDEARPEGETA